MSSRLRGGMRGPFGRSTLKSSSQLNSNQTSHFQCSWTRSIHFPCSLDKSSSFMWVLFDRLPESCRLDCFTVSWCELWFEKGNRLRNLESFTNSNVKNLNFGHNSKTTCTWRLLLHKLIGNLYCSVFLKYG